MPSWDSKRARSRSGLQALTWRAIFRATSSRSAGRPSNSPGEALSTSPRSSCSKSNTPQPESSRSTRLSVPCLPRKSEPRSDRNSTPRWSACPTPATLETRRWRTCSDTTLSNSLGSRVSAALTIRFRVGWPTCQFGFRWLCSSVTPYVRIVPSTRSSSASRMTPTSTSSDLDQSPRWTYARPSCNSFLNAFPTNSIAWSTLLLPDPLAPTNTSRGPSADRSRPDSPNPRKLRSFTLRIFIRKLASGTSG